MTRLRQLCNTCSVTILLLWGVVSAGLCADGTGATAEATASKPDSRRAVRVLSQAVGTDELLVALAEPGQIVALSHLARNPNFCAVSKEAEAFPCLPATGDAETALRYQPTLVLCADYSRIELINQIRRSGVRVITFSKYKTLEDSYANLRILAKELGAEAKAERLIAQCEQRVAELHRHLAGRAPVKVIAPSVYGVIPGAQTTFQDLCDHAGAENLAATLGRLVGHAAPPVEQMLIWPVDRVVVTGNSIDEALVPYRNLPPYQFMPVVKEGRAVLIKPYMISCVSHLRIDTYELLARALHPEAF